MLETADATGIMSDASSTNKQESAANTEYSTTNVMTEGVDESDVVKTDGKYIYMVEEGQISITDISKGKAWGKRRCFVLILRYRQIL